METTNNNFATLPRSAKFKEGLNLDRLTGHLNSTSSVGADPRSIFTLRANNAVGVPIFLGSEVVCQQN